MSGHLHQLLRCLGSHKKERWRFMFLPCGVLHRKKAIQKLSQSFFSTHTHTSGHTPPMPMFSCIYRQEARNSDFRLSRSTRSLMGEQRLHGNSPYNHNSVRLWCYTTGLSNIHWERLFSSYWKRPLTERWKAETHILTMTTWKWVPSFEIMLKI